MGTRWAFTLVELLVVITIIVVLLALLTPAVDRALQMAEQAVCMTNLKQQGTGLAMYHLENRKYWPGHHKPGMAFDPNNPQFVTGGDWIIVWPARLRKYTGNTTEVFNCPSADARAHWTKSYGHGSAEPQEYGYEAGEVPIQPGTWFSYGYNDWGIKENFQPHLGLGAWINQPTNKPPQQTRIRYPSDMFTVADSNETGSWDHSIDPTDGGDEWPGARHPGGMTAVLMADKHVQVMERDAMVDVSDNAMLARWNVDHQPHTEAVTQ